MASETVVDLANKAISQREQACKNLLEMAAEAGAAYDSGAPESQADASWEHLLTDQCSAVTANVDVYPNGFIYVVHECPSVTRDAH